MSAIRPAFPQAAPAQTAADLPSARNAQAAFFRAAMGPGAAAPAEAAPSAAIFSSIRTATPTRPAELALGQPDREPPRILRPGSLLDIRI